MTDHPEARRVLSFDMGSRNLAYCLVEAPTTVLKWGIIDLGKHAARVATDALIDTLRGDHAWMLEGNHDVVVELQPGSGVCKTLSHVLQTIFYWHSRTHIRFMRAGQKFRFDAETLAQRNPQTYTDRKHCAIAMAEKIVETQPTFLALLHSHKVKQRSDLADALVQGCQHLAERL